MRWALVLKMRLSLVACLIAGPLSAQTFAPVDVAEHVYDGGWEHFVGGGVAAFDCDGDALPELFAAGGASLAILFRNTSAGVVSFEPETPAELALTGLTGAYPLDVDSDGLVDLALLSTSKNMLMRGLGDCRFALMDLPSADRWTTSFSATWEDGNVWPTLAFGNYVDRTDPNGPFEACDVHTLYRPEGEAYGGPDLLAPGFCTLSMLFTDWNRTGRQDLRVSNDRHYYVRGGEEQLWAMQDAPTLYGESDGWLSHALWGMGIASRDITGDGLPDVYLTSMGDQRFQVRDGDGPTYNDAAYDFGLTAHVPFVGNDGRPSTGWHAVFGDVQNDGLDDVFVTKGNVEQMPGSAFDDPNNLLIREAEGFVERGDSAGVASMARSRGAAMADFNGDGLLDLAVVNRRAAMEVYQNTSADVGQFVGVTVLQDGPNRNAVGAWIELKLGDQIVAREITIGGGHAGGVLGPEHFGVGAASEAEFRVIWPDQTVSDWVTVPTGAYGTVRRDGDGLLVDF